MGVDIQIASISDVASLTQVEINSKLSSIPEHVDPIEVDYNIRLQRWKNYFNAQSPASSKPERIVIKAVDNGTMVGYLAGHLTSRFGMDAEIQSFYILKDHQGIGLGTQLLTRFVPWLKEQQVKKLCVGISAHNPYQAFYLKYGGTHYYPEWIYWDDLDLLMKKLQL